MPIEIASSRASSSLFSRIRAASFFKCTARCDPPMADQDGNAAFAAATAALVSSALASGTRQVSVVTALVSLVSG